MTATKTEKPILFSTELVQAILDGRKTQTRRVLKLDPAPDVIHHWKNDIWEAGWHIGDGEFKVNRLKSPYGMPGDELWVRETTYIDGYLDWFYQADDYPVAMWRNDGGPDCKYFEREESCTVPSIHMPREASRIQLTVENIRVERVQEITEEDAVAEGVRVERRESLIQSPRSAFSDLWDSINADRGYSWESNPWVWVVEFEVKNIKGA